MLFAIGGLESGGSERQLSELIAHLHPRYVDAHLLVTVDPGDNPRRRRITDAGARIHAIGPSGFRPVLLTRTLAQGIALVGRLRPDVVYPWLEETSFTMTLAARAFGLPAVIARRNVSGGAVEERSLIVHQAIRRVERLATVVTANSAAVLSQAERRGIDPARLVLVRNGHPSVPPLPPDARRSSRSGTWLGSGQRRATCGSSRSPARWTPERPGG